MLTKAARHEAMHALDDASRTMLSHIRVIVSGMHPTIEHEEKAAQCASVAAHYGRRLLEAASRPTL